MIRSRMVHRANVERNLSPGLDAYGNARPAEWGVHLPAQPCYYSVRAVRGLVQGEVTAILYTPQLLVPLGTDVREGDRVAGVTDRRGLAITADTLRVTGVWRRPDHLALTCEVAT